jgi:LysR family transcriptional regulator, glycine cleavage system transcriptional activator
MVSPRISPSLPPLTALRSFEAAARLGSFTAAADELLVTHGAVSRQVKLLEEWFGTELFVRHGKRLTLTDAGRVFAGRTSDAFEEISQAAKVLRAETSGPRVFCINALPTFAMRWLLPRLAKFQFMYPQVELRLVTSDAPISKLAPASFDVAIRRTGSALPSGFSTAAFLMEREVPVVSPAVLSTHSIQAPGDLASLPLLVAETRPGAWDRWFAATGNEASMTHATLQRFEHFYLALQAAIDGLGVALGPLPLVDDDLREGRLVVPVDGPYLSLSPYSWIATPAIEGDPIAVDFVRWLEEEGTIEEV